MSKAVSYLAVVVLAFLAGGLAFRLAGHALESAADPNRAEVQVSGQHAHTGPSRTFAIEGMTCQGCVDTITSALTRIPGVNSAKVSLQDKKAVVLADESQVPTEKLLAAITAAGYKVQLSSAAGSAVASPDSSVKPPLLVNITRGKNDLHAVSMALGLAQSAIKDGRKAAVFLNVEAPVFAAKDLGDDVQFADFPPVKKMLTDFVAMGGRVLICGHCAHVVKMQQGSMIDQANVLDHGELLASLTPGTIVVSY